MFLKEKKKGNNTVFFIEVLIAETTAFIVLRIYIGIVQEVTGDMCWVIVCLMVLLLIMALTKQILRHVHPDPVF